MRFKKPVVALSTAALLALAACGGGGDDGGGDGESGGSIREDIGNTGSATDPEREGPFERNADVERYLAQVRRIARLEESR